MNTVITTMSKLHSTKMQGNATK